MVKNVKKSTFSGRSVEECVGEDSFGPRMIVLKDNRRKRGNVRSHGKVEQPMQQGEGRSVRAQASGSWFTAREDATITKEITKNQVTLKCPRKWWRLLGKGRI